MAKAQVFSLPKQPSDPPLLRIEPFKGINLSVTPTQIDNHQSPDMLNTHTDERGALIKRTGYERIIPNALDGPINGVYSFMQENGAETFLIAQGTKLYKTNLLPDKTVRQDSVWTDEDLTKTWG